MNHFKNKSIAVGPVLQLNRNVQVCGCYWAFLMAVVTQQTVQPLSQKHTTDIQWYWHLNEHQIVTGVKEKYKVNLMTFVGLQNQPITWSNMVHIISKISLKNSGTCHVTSSIDNPTLAYIMHFQKTQDLSHDWVVFVGFFALFFTPLQAWQLDAEAASLWLWTFWWACLVSP